MSSFFFVLSHIVVPVVVALGFVARPLMWHLRSTAKNFTFQDVAELYLLTLCVTGATSGLLWLSALVWLP